MKFIFYQLIILFGFVSGSSKSNPTRAGTGGFKRAVGRVTNAHAVAAHTTSHPGPLDLRARRFELKNFDFSEMLKNIDSIINSYNQAIVRRNLKSQKDPYVSLYIVLCQIAMDKAVSSEDVKCTQTIEKGDDVKFQRAQKALGILMNSPEKSAINVNPRIVPPYPTRQFGMHSIFGGRSSPSSMALNGSPRRISSDGDSTSS